MRCTNSQQSNLRLKSIAHTHKKRFPCDVSSDNPLSDHILEDEESTEQIKFPRQELMKLLRSAYEAVEDIQNMLPQSMTEIDLEDSIPSADDMLIIYSVMQRYNQLEHIVLSSINPRQLESLIPWAEHRNLKVSRV